MPDARSTSFGVRECRLRPLPCVRIATITIATLASSAVHRAGLLSVLEAGLETFSPDSYPSTFAPVLVVRLDFAPADFNELTMLSVRVEHEDGERLSEIGFALTYMPPDEADQRLTHYWPLIHQLPLQVRRDGLHLVRLSVNGDEIRRLPFVVTSRLPQP